MLRLVEKLYRLVKERHQSMVMRRAGVTFGNGVAWSGNRPKLSNRGSIIIGESVQLRGTPKPVSMMTTENGLIELGDRAFLNTGVQIFSNLKVTIGSGSLIGDECLIYDTSFHAVHCDQQPISRAVVIGRNVWLGRSVIVLPGVTIGDHSVLAAGSVVFSDVPEAQVWRGNPAQFYKEVRIKDGFERS
jgi:acetyltransferase-like isoleucine patch superfamily enzyme